MNIFCQGDMFPLSEHILDMREECAFQPQFSRGHSDVTTSDPDSKMSYFFSVKAVVPKSVYTVLYFVIFCDTEVEHQQWQQGLPLKITVFQLEANIDWL